MFLLFPLPLIAFNAFHFRQVPRVYHDFSDAFSDCDDRRVERSLPVAVDAPHGALGEEGLCPAAAPDPTHEAAPVPDRDRRCKDR